MAGVLSLITGLGELFPANKTCKRPRQTQDFPMRRWLKAVLLLPLLAGGCVTHKLWTESRLDAWNEPAASPNLRLFRDERQDNFLVVYDEFSERHDSARTRAFFLHPSEKPQPLRGHPHFVNANWARRLTPVPVLSVVPTNSPELFCVVTQTNGVCLTIFSGGQPMGSYQLPVYDDGWGKVERIAWTPFAVTADLTIVGGFLGCLWIYSGGPGLNR
jgi:hypothetical protein